MRQTKQKKIILEAVRKLPGHPSAEDVYVALKPDHPQLSLATVYRNLNGFCNRGLLLKVEAPNRAVHFDKNVHEHAHGICKECDDIIDIEIPDMEAFRDFMKNWSEMEVDNYNLILYGTCRNCLQKKAN